MLRHYLVAVLLLLYSSYSYCEIITGQTANAIKNGTNWVMTNVLPQHTGLVVNAVSYRYTTTKLPSDPMLVTVQNLNAKGDGYIFRSKDDWTGLPGNTIIKTVPADNIPLKYWGSGEIAVEGKGEVVNPSVLYSYRYDTCFGPVITDPRCPNYKINIPENKFGDPLEDEYTKNLLDRKTALENEEEAERSGRLLKKEQDDKKRSSIVNKTVQNSLITAEAAAQAAAFEALNNIPNFALYNKALFGGVYQETLKYVDKVLPDSRNGLRLNYSQQLLHNQMIDLQYRTKLQGVQND
jgi:hypothetical protein